MKLVVLEVSDDKIADRFIQEWQDIEGRCGLDDGTVFEAPIVGVFKVPTVFCDPSDGHRGKKTDSGWTRGKKYGWWVCGVCKKPTRQWGTNLNALLSSARNLMEENGILGAAQKVE